MNEQEYLHYEALRRYNAWTTRLLLLYANSIFAIAGTIMLYITNDPNNLLLGFGTWLYGMVLIWAQRGGE